MISGFGFSANTATTASTGFGGGEYYQSSNLKKAWTVNKKFQMRGKVMQTIPRPHNTATEVL